MRAREFISEDSGATTAGSVATVAMPLGRALSRTQFPKTAKYMNSFKPTKEQKKHARRGT